MIILHSKQPAIVMSMEMAALEEKLFVAFDMKLQNLSAGDLHYFDSQITAAEFRDFNQVKGREIAVLPLEVTSEYIKQQIQDGFKNGETTPNVKLAIEDILTRYEAYVFYKATNDLSAEMDSFDWTKTFYDPLEANTEAETLQDKMEFTRLEQLIEDLSLFAATGVEARDFVSQLLDRHWTGQPMEVQKESVLEGKLSHPKEGQFMLSGDLHSISPELVYEAGIALVKGREWVAYNEIEYKLDTSNTFFFKHRDEADEFADNNISDVDNFIVIRAKDIDDLLRQIPCDTNQFISSTKNNVMNMENLQFLKELLKGKGFGEELWPLLEKFIREGVQKFELTFKTEINNLPFEATLKFNKGKSGEMYFFNGYDAKLTRSNGQEMKQHFEIKKGLGMTVKEAYNQLQGRAVMKKLKGLDSTGADTEWSWLNFKKQDARGNYEVQTMPGDKFDLMAAVSKFAFLELDGGDKEKDFIRSIERGNAQSASLEKEEEPMKVFVEANPSYKTINVYDNHFTLLKHQDLPKSQRPENSVAGDNKQQPATRQQQSNNQTNGKEKNRTPRVTH